MKRQARLSTVFNSLLIYGIKPFQKLVWNMKSCTYANNERFYVLAVITHFHVLKGSTSFYVWVWVLDDRLDGWFDTRIKKRKITVSSTIFKKICFTSIHFKHFKQARIHFPSISFEIILELGLSYVWNKYNGIRRDQETHENETWTRDWKLKVQQRGRWNHWVSQSSNSRSGII